MREDLQKLQDVHDELKGLVESVIADRTRMSLFLENLRTGEEMEKAISKGWGGGAAVFSGYGDYEWLEDWCSALVTNRMHGRISLNEACFVGSRLSNEGAEKLGVLAHYMDVVVGVELEDDSEHYTGRLASVTNALGSHDSVFQYQKAYTKLCPNLSKLWYSMYNQASEVGAVGEVRAWRMDPFNCEPLRSVQVWEPKRTVEGRPGGEENYAHVWVECMGDPVSESIAQIPNGIVENPEYYWKDGNEGRYTVPPMRGHFDYYLRTCHRMGVGQMTFYSARNRSWGDQLIWDANPALWDDLIHSCNAYNEGERSLVSTWTEAYKERNPYVCTVKLRV